MIVHRRTAPVFGLLMVFVLVLAACGPATLPPTAQPTEPPAPTEVSASPTELSAPTVEVAPTEAPAPTTEPTVAEAPAAEIPENLLVFVQRNEFTNLDPSRSASGEPRVLANVYETLTFLNPPGSAEILSPKLATSWESNPEGTEWTFKIRQGVKFHDGTDLNAAAVKYSIDRTISLGQGSAYILDPIQEIVVNDDYTVSFKLKYAAPLDIILATPYAAWIMSPTTTEAHDEAWFQEHDAGSGPYVIDSRERGARVLLKAFPGYWGGWRTGQFTSASIEIVDDTVVRQQMIESGDADITYGLQRESIPALKENPDVTVYVGPSYENMMSWFNVTKPPLDNKLVRQALSYAVPYDQIIQGVLLGGGTQSHGPVPAGIWGHSDDLFQYNYDLDKARSLLAEAGYPDGGFDLVYTFVAGDFDEQQVGELWKAELAKLGINMELQGMTWDAQWQLAKSDPKAAQDIYTMWWYPDIATPNAFLYLTFHCEDKPYFNVAYYCNPNFDKLIDDANTLSSTDRAKSTEMFIDAQKILVDDAPATFVFDNSDTHILRSDIKGYVDNPAYPHVFFFYELSR
jgi:peptide/nickel transport system substrate-binding protein